jgi:hypothetical protein
MNAGGTTKRRVRLTKAGRALLATHATLRSTARITLGSGSGRRVHRERLTLRRR